MGEHRHNPQRRTGYGPPERQYRAYLQEQAAFWRAHWGKPVYERMTGKGTRQSLRRIARAEFKRLLKGEQGARAGFVVHSPSLQPRNNARRRGLWRIAHSDS